MKRKRPTKEQVQKWQQKNLEKKLEKEYAEKILQKIKNETKTYGTIIAPTWEIIGYILEENEIGKLIGCIKRLDEIGKVFFILKDDGWYLDYIPI